MEMKTTLGGRVYHVDLTRAESLAIKLEFGGAQPNHFGAPKAESKTFEIYKKFFEALKIEH